MKKMKKRLAVILSMALILIMGLSLSACGGLGGGSGISLPSGGGSGSGKSASQTQDTIHISIENQMAYGIWYVYISPEEDSDWNETDILDNGDNPILEDGESVDTYFETVSASGRYDIKIKDEDDDYYEYYGVPIQNGDTISFVWEVSEDPKVVVNGSTHVTGTLVGGESGATSSSTAPSDAVNISLFNAMAYDIWYLYISPSEDSDWNEEDVLDNSDNPILGEDESAEAYFTTVSSSGTYDVKFKDEEDDIYEFYGVPIHDGDSLSIEWWENENPKIVVNGNVTIEGEMVGH